MGSRLFRVILGAVAGLAAFLVVAAILVMWLVDLDQHKPRIERIASEALGMPVTIAGAISVRFRPDLNISVENLRVGEGDEPLAMINRLFIGLDSSALLRRAVLPTAIVVHGIRVVLVRDAAGNFNLPKAGSAETAGGDFTVPGALLGDVHLTYRDLGVGVEYHARNCAIELADISLTAGKGPEHANARGSVDCLSVEIPYATGRDLSARFHAEGGLITMDPVHITLFEGTGAGRLVADLRGAQPVFELDYAVTQFSLESFVATLEQSARASGALDLRVKLRVRGDGIEAWRRSAAGDVSVRGTNLSVEGIDLDAQLARYETSQNFNLVDAGAFLFAGPIGVVVTKGHDFSQVLLGSGGRTLLSRIVSDWTVNGGVAEAKDVATATAAHRLAMKGKLDFVSQRFDGLVVAVLDQDGCATVQQTVRGAFDRPTVDTPSFLRSLTAPVTRLLGRAADLLPGRSATAPAACTPFYTGTVAAPAQ